MPRQLPPSDAVDPDQSVGNPKRVFVERLLSSKCGLAADAVWLAPLVESALGSNRDRTAASDEDFESRLNQVAHVCEGAPGDRGASLLIVLALLCGALRPWRTIRTGTVDDGWRASKQQRREFVSEFARHVDFDAVLRRGWPAPLTAAWSDAFRGRDCRRWKLLRRLLLSSGAVRLDRLIDIGPLRRCGGETGWIPTEGLSSTVGRIEWTDGISWRSTTALRPWLWYEGPAVLDHLRGAFVAEPTETLPALASGIAREVLAYIESIPEPPLPGERPRPWTPNQRHHLAMEGTDAATRSAVRPFFEHLRRLVEESGLRTRPDFRELLLLYFRIAYDGGPEECPKSLKGEALALAGEDLARMRKVFAAANEPGDTPQAREYIRTCWHFYNCCMVAARHKGIWTCLKPLLLAIRQLATPCVTSDLRYWVEPQLAERPPEPWSELPRLAVGTVHGFARHAESTDPDLCELREDFARFCLDRLTDKWTAAERDSAKAETRARTDADMVEPVAAWRYCLVRAIADLRANPEGRGHRALHWSSQNDPDAAVREAAHRAYETIRHARGLPERVSPRRAVISALWWWRQAHLLGLGIQPDRDLAQRTREKELTRTKEIERAHRSPQ